jgi:hypothetical protein
VPFTISLINSMDVDDTIEVMNGFDISCCMISVAIAKDRTFTFRFGDINGMDVRDHCTEQFGSKGTVRSRVLGLRAVGAMRHNLGRGGTRGVARGVVRSQ